MKVLPIWNNTFHFSRTARVQPTDSTGATTFDSKKPSVPPVVSSQYANGHHPSPDNPTNESTTKIVENGCSAYDLEDEIDNDDDQWSDWEHDPVSREPSTGISQPIPSSSSSTIQEQVISNPVCSSNKSLKLNKTTKSKWNPNAPL